MFSTIYYGNSLKEWLISLAIVTGAILLNLVITFLNNKIFKRIASRTAGKFDDKILEKLEAPVKFAIILLGIWIAFNHLEFSKKTVEFVSKTYNFLIVLNITWVVVRFVGALIGNLLMPAAKEINKRKAKRRKQQDSETEKIIKHQAEEKSKQYLDETLMPVVQRTVDAVIWIIGVMMALKNVGVDVGALLAGLGIGGLAFALAAQDTLKNIFGGITIFFDRPFKIGDRIKVDGFDGIVEDIGMRSTRIRTLERRLVTISNSKIVDCSIENISNEPMRRVLIKLGLTYSTSPEKMQQAIEILKNLPNKILLIDKETTASFTDYSASSLDITFIYWIKQSSDVMETTSAVNLEILNAFNDAALNFAFPSQTVYLEK
ncbi:MAG: mechanosensitive ion channel family protein [Paludibacter sp.]|jgi:MscS family membrane protein|nr:mechanosensitive ion channel family protein [Paludibacter sp.]